MAGLNGQISPLDQYERGVGGYDGMVGKIRVKPINRMSSLPLNAGRPIIEHVNTFSSRLQQYFSRLYVNPDEAYRQSRKEASNMRRDPVIMEPLRQRQLATALLDWQIVPEDENDPVQEFVCELLTTRIRRTPAFLKMKMALLEALWFGRYGVNMVYKWDDRDPMTMVVDRWVPVHGDKLKFEHNTGRVGIMTYSISGTGTGFHEVRISDESRVMMLDPEDREALIVHKHEIEDGEFFDAETGGSIHGVGLRTRVYWPWFLKQRLLQWLMDFGERTGMGVQIWYYEAGNPQSEAMVREAAERYSNENVVLFPRPIGSEGQGPGYERIDPSTGGSAFFRELLDDYFGAQMKRMIVGQVLSSEAHGTGLGSGVADQHGETLSRIVEFDSINLSETLTDEFLWPMAKWNFPGIDWKPKLEIVTEDNDPDKLLKAAKTFQEMGGELGEDQVREIIGLPAPDNSDRILQPMGSGQGFDDAFGGGMPGGMPGGPAMPPMGPGGDESGFDDGFDDDGMEPGPEKYGAAQWDESKHPRGDDGKFAEVPGGSRDEATNEIAVADGPELDLSANPFPVGDLEVDDSEEPTQQPNHYSVVLKNYKKGDELLAMIGQHAGEIDDLSQQIKAMDKKASKICKNAFKSAEQLLEEEKPGYLDTMKSRIQSLLSEAKEREAWMKEHWQDEGGSAWEAVAVEFDNANRKANQLNEILKNKLAEVSQEHKQKFRDHLSAVQEIEYKKHKAQHGLKQAVHFAMEIPEEERQGIEAVEDWVDEYSPLDPSKRKALSETFGMATKWMSRMFARRNMPLYNLETMSKHKQKGHLIPDAAANNTGTFPVKYVHPDLDDKNDTGRAHYHPEGGLGVGKIVMNHLHGADSAIHEIGHAIDHTNQEIANAVQDFWSDRCGSERPIKLADEFSGFASHERGRKDDFGKIHGDERRAAYYNGKMYPSGQTEILSMGLEKMYSDPVALSKDPEYFKLVAAILDGTIGGNKGIQQ